MFQYKEAQIAVIKGEHSRTFALTIGKVINPKGDCVLMQGWLDHGKKPKTRKFPHNVHALKLNLELFKINLEKCGKPYE